MEQPLNVAAIDIAAEDALRISRTRDEIELASKSRDCHRLLRTKPGLTQFDRCAGFDDAVASSRIAIRCAIKGQSASLPSPADCGAERGSLTIRWRSTGGSIAFGCKWN
jgi:hypothetical protein